MGGRVGRAREAGPGGERATRGKHQPAPHTNPDGSRPPPLPSTSQNTSTPTPTSTNRPLILGIAPATAVSSAGPNSQPSGELPAPYEFNKEGLRGAIEKKLPEIRECYEAWQLNRLAGRRLQMDAGASFGVALDRSEKLPVYARQGVAFAWLISPVVKSLEVFRLDGTTFRLIATHAGDAPVRAEPFEELALDLRTLWEL